VTSALIDLRPLRTCAAFRRWWVGRSISGFGGQMTVIAVMYQVWTLTRSTAWTGAAALASALPILVVGLFGGAVVDRSDRRRLMIITISAQALLSALLAVQAFALHLPVLGILGLVAAQSVAGAFGGPAARTVIPRLLPASQIAAGLALNQIAFQAALLAGPALGGLLIGAIGVGGCYLVDVATFLFGFYGVLGLPSMPPVGEPAKAGWRGVVDGLAFLRHAPLVRGALLTDLAIGVLSFPISLFPLLNQERFDGDPRTLGLFLSAIAVGGLVASALSGTFTRSRRPGVGMLTGAGAWCLSMIGLALAPGAWWALGALVVAGAADTVTVVCRSTLVQLGTPDALRGRVSAVELAVGAGGPNLGNLRAGLVATATSGTFALISGGLVALLAVATLATATPGLRRPAETVRPDAA
jgi:MFS family permease